LFERLLLKMNSTLKKLGEKHLEMTDRTDSVPSHSGQNVLPCSPLFSCLLRHALRHRQRLVVRDAQEGIEKTHAELLGDVLKLRSKIKSSLSRETVERIEGPDEVYISLLAPGGYCYAVAFLAILALGAAVVPLSTAISVKEAVYFIEKSQSVLVLGCNSSLKLAKELELLRQQDDSNFQCVHIESALIGAPISVGNVVISSNRYLDDNGPGVVIFTSGTTGPPKGSVMRRGYTFDAPLAIIDHFNITAEDVMLHVLPMHHATGVGISFLPFLVAGACIEFRAGGFDEVWMWERWREGGLDPHKRITFFSGVPYVELHARPD
jgi:malonyl-CoA/methylmalonyl-CoA synthetase